MDVRAVAAALVGRSDLQDWRVVLGPRSTGGPDEVIVHVVPVGNELADGLADAVAGDVLAAAGVRPAEVVLAAAGRLPAGATTVSRRVLLR